MSGWTVPDFGFAVLERSQPSQPQPEASTACLRSRAARVAGNVSLSSATAMPRRAAAGIRVHAA